MILWRLVLCSTHTPSSKTKFKMRWKIRNYITELFTNFSVHTFGYMANITWVRYPKQNDRGIIGMDVMNPNEPIVWCSDDEKGFFQFLRTFSLFVEAHVEMPSRLVVTTKMRGISSMREKIAPTTIFKDDVKAILYYISTRVG